MTPLQQAYLNKLRATADANLSFFEKNMLHLHLLLTKDVPSASLDISDQGDLTIQYENGESRSVTADVMESEASLVHFADIKDRPQLVAFHRLRSVVSDPSHGEMQRYHYSNLDADYPNRAKQHFVKHYPDSAGVSRYPDFGEKNIPLLIVFGSGLGWHLPRLILEYRIHHLIVIDIDADAFRLSTFFQDYVLLSRLAMGKGTDLTFIIQPEIEEVAISLMRAMIRIEGGLPPFFIHGAALFYAIDDTEALDSIRTTIVETLWEMYFGLGYFDDELISIKHTFDNLRYEFPIYMKPNSVSEDAIAFIVGSGPSLDNLLPILREYGDRAVIFSCGTSLSGMANAGIRPDFHVEKERPYIQYEVITKTVGKDFLKGIHFLGLSVVHPEVFNLFENRGVIMKSADTMGCLLLKEGIPPEVLLAGQPTVTNTAIEFAISVGFKQIYLFGVDMGYKNKEEHHSKHTFYLNRLPEEDHLKKLLSEHPGVHTTLPGNFGGEVSTTRILAMSRKAMRNVISSRPEVKVFNLNDGALIEGAFPLHPEEFTCKSTPEHKLAAMDAISGAFEVRKFNAPQLKVNLLEQIDRFIKDMKAIIHEQHETYWDVIKKLEKLHLYVTAEAYTSSPAGWLFRGTVNQLLSLSYNAISVIKDKDEAVAKAEFDFANLMDCLDQARVEVAQVL